MSYVAMAAEVLQKLDLAQGALGQDLFAEDIGDLLDGNAFVCLIVHGSAICEKLRSATAGSTYNITE